MRVCAYFLKPPTENGVTPATSRIQSTYLIQSVVPVPETVVLVSRSTSCARTVNPLGLWPLQDAFHDHEVGCASYNKLNGLNFRVYGLGPNLAHLLPSNGCPCLSGIVQRERQEQAILVQGSGIG